jgi:hypothetical protein
MEQAQRRRFVLIGVILLAILIFMDPFGIIEGIVAGGGRPRVPQEQSAELLSYIEENYRQPTDYVVDQFEQAQIVFLGEFPQIADHARFVQELIPRLYEAGIRHLALQHALSADQARIDELLTADSFDTAAAEQILFRRLSIWGYEEYRGIFRAAWEVNQRRPQGSEPFRIIGLEVVHHYEHITEQSDVQDPEVVQKVFADGVPDQHMASVIQERLVEPGHQALVYAGVQHAFTDFESPQYQAEMRSLGFDETRRAGHIIHERIGEQAVTVYLHAPWPAPQDSRQRFSYAARGVIDAVIEQLDPERRRAGFDVQGSPFGDLTIERTQYVAEGESIRFAELTDGYVILGPVNRYDSATPIEGFITQENAGEARRRFPGPIPDNANAQQLQSYMSRVSDNLASQLQDY